MDHLRKWLSKLMTPKDWIASFIAVLALVTSVWSGIATRSFNRLTARPHMHIWEEFAPSSNRLGLQVGDVGPGIAIVDQFNLFYDNEALTGSLREQWRKFQEKTNSTAWTNTGGVQQGDTVPPPGIADILIIVDETQFHQADSQQWKAQIPRIKEVVQHLTVDIKYHSVYGEGFEITKQALNTEQFRKRNWFGQYVDWQP